MKAVTGLMRLARRKPCRAFTAILLETKLWKIVSRKRQLSTLISPRAYGYETCHGLSGKGRFRCNHGFFSLVFSSRGTWPPRRQSTLRFQGTEKDSPLRCPHTRMTFSRGRRKRTKVQSSGTGCRRNTNGTRAARPDTPGRCAVSEMGSLRLIGSPPTPLGITGRVSCLRRE